MVDQPDTNQILLRSLGGFVRITEDSYEVDQNGFHYNLKQSKAILTCIKSINPSFSQPKESIQYLECIVNHYLKMADVDVQWNRDALVKEFKAFRGRVNQLSKFITNISPQAAFEIQRSGMREKAKEVSGALVLFDDLSNVLRKAKMFVDIALEGKKGRPKKLHEYWALGALDRFWDNYGNGRMTKLFHGNTGKLTDFGRFLKVVIDPLDCGVKYMKTEKGSEYKLRRWTPYVSKYLKMSHGSLRVIKKSAKKS